MFDPSEQSKQKQVTIIKALAENYAIVKGEIGQLESELTDKKKTLKQITISLHSVMVEAGQTSTKLDNGLTPSRSITRKYYTQAGKTNDDLQDFLKDCNLDSIIKPTVNFNTLRATITAADGNLFSVLDGKLFNVVDEPTIRMGGIANFNSKG